MSYYNIDYLLINTPKKYHYQIKCAYEEGKRAKTRELRQLVQDFIRLADLDLENEP